MRKNRFEQLNTKLLLIVLLFSFPNIKATNLVDTITFKDINIIVAPSEQSNYSDSIFDITIQLNIAGDDSLLNKIYVKIQSGENGAVLFNQTLNYKNLSISPTQLSQNSSYYLLEGMINIQTGYYNLLQYSLSDLNFLIQFENDNDVLFPIIKRKASITN
jgi:hypothetical protein